jgi:hypothetical protein
LIIHLEETVEKLIEKYGRPDAVAERSDHPWPTTERYYQKIRDQLEKMEGSLDEGFDPVFFAVQVEISARSNDERDRARFENRLRAALLADGWNAVTFEADKRGYGMVRVTLFALRQPLLVEMVDGTLFPAPLAEREVPSDEDFWSPSVWMESPADAATRIAREGCWRYTHEHRELIPPHRIAAVQWRRRP